MSDIRIPGGILTAAGDDYKPGDLPPSGYLDWHEWAEVQHKAGLRQVECGRCGKWRYPQELAAIGDIHSVRDNRGRPVSLKSAVCAVCLVDQEEK